MSQGLQDGRGHPKTSLPAEEGWGPDRTASDPSSVSHRFTWLRSFYLQEALPAVTVLFYSVFWSKRSDLFLVNSPSSYRDAQGLLPPSCLVTHPPEVQGTIWGYKSCLGVRLPVSKATWYLWDAGKVTYSSGALCQPQGGLGRNQRNHKVRDSIWPSARTKCSVSIGCGNDDGNRNKDPSSQTRLLSTAYRLKPKTEAERSQVTSTQSHRCLVVKQDLNHIHLAPGS